MSFVDSLYSSLFSLFYTSKGIAVDHWKFRGQEENELGADFIQLKIDILSKYGVKNLRNAWVSVVSALEQENKTIKERGLSSWPEIDFSDLGKLPEGISDKVRERGIVIVRNILPKEQATSWKEDLHEYLQNNPDVLPAYPENNPNPWLYRSYYSPVQNIIRSHPNSLKVQKFLNELWDGYSDSTASPLPLAYADALRFRQPGGFSPVVQPHIDAGSLDRWADENYQAYYKNIFGGKWKDHNPFDIEARRKANSAKFPGQQQSTVLRTFQGWTALSPSGGDFGTSALAVYPNLKLGIAYVLLRPFFKPPSSGSLDPTLWELDLSDTFHGAGKGLGQKVRPETHPHLELEHTLALTPRINPGDAVYWHSDIIHAVDPTLRGNDPAVVLYIPAVPLTEASVTYVKGQRDALLDDGKTPPDFTNWFVGYEGKARGWKDVKEVLHPEGLQAFGLKEISGDGVLVDRANKILGFAK